MKSRVLSVLLVALLLSSTLLYSVDGSANRYLRFGRTIGRRKYRARPRSNVQADESLLPSNQREIGRGSVANDNDYLPRFN